MEYGAVATASYASPTCTQQIRALAAADGGAPTTVPRQRPIRHAMDCITTAESVSICFASLARTGGRYVCLEGLAEAWRTRGRAVVHTKEVMGYEGLGIRVDFGGKAGAASYSREANDALFGMIAGWTVEMQTGLDAGLIKTHPVREVPGAWQGIITGLDELRRGEVRGQKLVVRISHV